MRNTKLLFLSIAGRDKEVWDYMDQYDQSSVVQEDKYRLYPYLSLIDMHVYSQEEEQIANHKEELVVYSLDSFKEVLVLHSLGMELSEIKEALKGDSNGQTN